MDECRIACRHRLVPGVVGGARVCLLHHVRQLGPVLLLDVPAGSGRVRAVGLLSPARLLQLLRRHRLRMLQSNECHRCPRGLLPVNHHLRTFPVFSFQLLNRTDLADPYLGDLQSQLVFGLVVSWLFVFIGLPPICCSLPAYRGFQGYRLNRLGCLIHRYISLLPRTFCSRCIFQL